MIHMMSMSKRLQNLCFSSSSMAFAAYLHHPSSSALDFRKFIEEFVSSPSQEDTTLLSLCLTWQRGKQGRILNCVQALPQSYHLSSLQTLVLRYLKLELLETTSLGEWINSSFPSLKKLVLYFEHCAYNANQAVFINCPSLREIHVSGPENSSFDQNFRLKIFCSSLEQLTIKNFVFEAATCEIVILGKQLQTLYVDRAKFMNCLSLGHSFKIHAPKLRIFHWIGSPILQFKGSDESFQLLEKVVLNVEGKHDAIYNKFLAILLRSTQHAIRLDRIVSSQKL